GRRGAGSRARGRVIAKIRKELPQVRRDPLALALALVLPAGINALLGTAISLTVTDLPIAVQDLDQTPLSRQYVDAFRSSLTFRLVSLPPATPPETMLVSDRARAVLIIPEHFTRDVRRGRRAEAQVLVDASDANTARLVQGGATQITRSFARQLDPTRPDPAVRAAIRLWFNPGREPKKFYGPGMFVLALSIF